MGKLILLTSVLLVVLIVSSCDGFLNQVPDDRLTMEQVFDRRDLSEQYLANIYNYIRDESFKTRDAPWDGLSDDIDITYDRANYHTYQMNLGSWTPSDGYYDYWQHYYAGIRKATHFINNIDGNEEILRLSDGEQLIDRFKAEARFLRAFYYFNLLRQYGPVIIIGDKEIPEDMPLKDMQFIRSSYDESVDYIIEELEIAEENLPFHFTQQSSQDYGRATQTMSMAVKSRMLLYAASPQFNGNEDYATFQNPDGKQLISTTYNHEKWKSAADAAKEIINTGAFDLYKVYSEGEIDPLLSCRNVFLVPWNDEVIFVRPSNNLFAGERTQTPRSGGGYAGVGVTQQLVDAFHMEDGELPILGYNSDGSPVINPEANYTEEGFSTEEGEYTRSGTYNMYVNREPRFYVNVIYNRSQWINTSEGVKIVGTHYTGESGKRGDFNYSRTGYIAKKYVHPDTNPRINEHTSRPYLMYRYAEVLLNYIEALNEYDPGHSDILNYLNEIRERAGIPAIQSGLNQEEMREIIRRERRVELANEQLRYFDTRRWKIAEETDGGEFYGMDIDSDPPEFYKRTAFETRVFQKKHYLFPIAQFELDRNSNLVQNPGW
ncbi:MAG: RagB/SusD family nutrient uptake outer membrane protein [Balneolaceae bacterium]